MFCNMTDNMVPIDIIEQTVYVVEFAEMFWTIVRERRRSDSVLWQKTLYQQKIRKPMDNTKTPQKLRLHDDCGPT